MNKASRSRIKNVEKAWNNVMYLSLQYFLVPLNRLELLARLVYLPFEFLDTTVTIRSTGWVSVRHHTTILIFLAKAEAIRCPEGNKTTLYATRAK